jgi:hypothetical protein
MFDVFHININQIKYIIKIETRTNGVKIKLPDINIAVKIKSGINKIKDKFILFSEFLSIFNNFIVNQNKLTIIIL